MALIRLMTEADVPAVSRIRVRGWRAAYGGIVPRSYLDAMDADEDAARRREFLAHSAGRVRDLVAVEADEVVGWAAFGPYRGEDTGAENGELYALYVRPESIGTGIGRALTAAVLEQSAELGRRTVALWVLADNARARRFYAAAGFAPDGAEMTDTYDGVPLRELRYTIPLP
ncbi:MULTISPECIES: GNAT family N-acetyltransferase [unclassified Streptomyces]|uniref:GNAT family N-acetyltransferase n=1 Tax=unclassified Streptomyces TaxID=2593676 RepID=UPI002E2E69EF|nr:GNAT family N-acetyltransferase [Streptomyces sp. NBC_00223]